MNTTYTFTTADGSRYSAKAKNRFEAQNAVELAYHISMSGAKFEEIYKLRVVRTGRV